LNDEHNQHNANAATNGPEWWIACKACDGQGYSFADEEAAHLGMADSCSVCGGAGGFSALVIADEAVEFDLDDDQDESDETDIEEVAE
jgi:hypothetical protein